jgi:hypothetical protein
MRAVHDGDTWAPRVQRRRRKGVLEIPREYCSIALDMMQMSGNWRS